MATQQERSRRTIALLLEAGRSLMAKQGYAGVTIDDITGMAGVAKGAFYHHFPSKHALLDALVDRLQAELAAELSRHGRTGPASSNDLAEALAGYLRCAVHPSRKGLLLIDGPSVLGWQRWREIDDRHFAGMTREAVASILPRADEETVSAATHLILGAVMEAAMATGRSDDPEREAVRYAELLTALLNGLELQFTP